MVKELSEGHLYELQTMTGVSDSNSINMRHDVFLYSGTIYLYLDHCPYTEVHSILDVKKNKIFYTNNDFSLTKNSLEVIYDGRSPKKIR